MKRPGLLATLSLGLALWVLPVALPTQAQSATDLNMGQQVQYDAVNQIYTLSWWGISGWTYFVQESDDLVNWTWVPIIESGNNAILEYGFTTNATKLFFRITANNTPTTDPYTADFDGDGISNWNEIQVGSSPINYYSQPNGSGGALTITPAISIVSGNSQVGNPGELSDQPLVAKVTNSSGGAVLPNAPVTFTVTSGGGLLMDALGNEGSVLTLSTDLTGQAEVWYENPSTYNTSSTITASSSGQSATFTGTTSSGDGTFDGPTDLQVNGIAGAEYDLSWVNHASTATGILIQQSVDNGITWTTTATLSNPTTNSYVVTGCTPSAIYSFRVAGTK